MKKRNLKSLELNKKSISKLKSIDVVVRGGEFCESSNAIFLCEAACFTGCDEGTRPVCI